ncbi:MAG: hypothetical protein KAU60_04270, partial [Desulfobacterales bacterium]|nr:hypothetical protein [Desulfobacterales bacterium]
QSGIQYSFDTQYRKIETFEKCPLFVISTKVGIQSYQRLIDSRFRGNEHRRKKFKGLKAF